MLFFLFEPDIQQHGVVVGEPEPVVLRLHARELHIRREDEAVDHVVLRGVAPGVIGLVVEAMGAVESVMMPELTLPIGGMG